MGKGKGNGQKVYIPNQREKIKSEEPKKYFIPPTNEAYIEYEDLLSEIQE